MSKSSALTERKKQYAVELYKVANDLRMAVFVNGGNPDDIMKVATEALRLTRIIDNPILGNTNTKTK